MKNAIIIKSTLNSSLFIGRYGVRYNKIPTQAQGFTSRRAAMTYIECELNGDTQGFEVVSL